MTRKAPYLAFILSTSLISLIASIAGDWPFGRFVTSDSLRAALYTLMGIAIGVGALAFLMGTVRIFTPKTILLLRVMKSPWNQLALWSLFMAVFLLVEGTDDVDLKSTVTL